MNHEVCEVYAVMHLINIYIFILYSDLYVDCKYLRKLLIVHQKCKLLKFFTLNTEYLTNTYT